MTLTKGEEDQRGSRQPGVCATVPFKTAPCGRTQLGPSNEILTGEQSGSAEKKIKKKKVKSDAAFQCAVNSEVIQAHPAV